MINSRLLLSLAILLCTLPSMAQKDKAKSKFVFGDIKPDDFTPAFYPVDSSAAGVFLYDVGSSEYTGNNKMYFSVVFQKAARIRLLNKNSFADLATVKIYLNDDGIDKQDKLDNFEAATYNMENGQVVVTKVDKNAFFKEKEDGFQVLKFTFPNIKEGSIVEYNYKIISPEPHFLKSWTFQQNYPKLWSEYTIAVPKRFEFMTFNQGYLPYEIDKQESSMVSFLMQDKGDSWAAGKPDILSVSTLVNKHQWAIKNVPAMKKEAYTTTIENYRSRISFQLSAVIDDEGVHQWLKGWNNMATDLMENKYFGLYLTGDLSWLNEYLKSAGATGLNLADNANAVYKYVQNNFSCTDDNSIWLSQPLTAIASQKKGTSTDINMLLVGLLRAANLDAYPVLLSTREHGKAYDLYPIMEKFNCVIAQVNINGKSYLLDAANKHVAFGHLSDECYNGNARLVAPVPALIDLSADSLKEASRTMVSLFNDGPGKSSGTLSTQLGEMRSFDLRRLLSKESQAVFFTDIKKEYTDNINIDNTGIDSLEMLSEPITVRFDLGTKFTEDIVYFNPMMGESEKENPFTAAQRFYPVEMPYAKDETYLFNMEVPEGYKVDELPKSARINFNENEGSFEYIIAESGGRIQMRCHLIFNKANFEPGDYESLREFYGFVVQKESEQIVFKKNN